MPKFEKAKAFARKHKDAIVLITVAVVGGIAVVATIAAVTKAPTFGPADDSIVIDTHPDGSFTVRAA